jgi:serine/threonine protein kinase
MTGPGECIPRSTVPTPTASAPADARVGTRLGDYLILGVLGRGNMAIVYEAEHVGLARRVALKVLSPMRTSEKATERFVREAQACARLNHPNVVAVHAAGEHDGVHFLAMELIRGRSVYQMIKMQGALELAEAGRLSIDVCRALSAAHAAGIIHRDVKPANILRTEDGVGKLTDFGLVKLTDGVGERLTREGRVVGTPQFIAPELCMNRPADERTDVYGLGGTYYQMLTGKAPYPFEHPVDLMRAHVTNPVPDPRQADPRIPPVCAAVVKRAMAKAPEERYATAAEMESALTIALAGTADWNASPSAEAGTGAEFSGDYAMPADDAGSGSEAEGPPGGLSGTGGI